MGALKTINRKAGTGAADLAGVGELAYQLAGLKQTLVDGATAGTKMAIAAMTPDDVIVGVVAFPDAGGVPVDDTANVSIAPLGAVGTVTIAGVNDGDSVTIDGQAFVFKDAPTAQNHVLREAGDNEANAQALVDTIEAWKHSYGRGNNRGSLSYSPSVDGAVVTFTAAAAGTSGNAITLTSSNGTRLAVSGSGTLAGGTATGGITSTTNHATNTLLVTWFDVQR